MSSLNKMKKTKNSKKKHAFKLDDLSEDFRSFTSNTSSKTSLNHSSEPTANNFLNYNEVITNLLDSYKPEDLLVDQREYTDVNNSNYSSLISQSEDFSIKHETEPLIEENQLDELKLSSDTENTSDKPTDVQIMENHELNVEPNKTNKDEVLIEEAEKNSSIIDTKSIDLDKQRNSNESTKSLNKNFDNLDKEHIVPSYGQVDELKLSTDQSESEEPIETSELETNNSESKENDLQESSDNQVSANNQTGEYENNSTGDEYESIKNTHEEESDIEQETVESVNTESFEEEAINNEVPTEELTSNDEPTNTNKTVVETNPEMLNEKTENKESIEEQNEEMKDSKSEEFIKPSSDESTTPSTQIDTVNEQQRTIKDENIKQDTLEFVEAVNTEQLEEETIKTEVPILPEELRLIDNTTKTDLENVDLETKLDEVTKSIEQNLKSNEEISLKSDEFHQTPSYEQYESTTTTTTQIDTINEQQIKNDKENESQNIVETDSNVANQESESIKEQILKGTSQKPTVYPSENKTLKNENRKVVSKNHENSANKLVWGSIVIAAVSIGATLFAKFKNKF